MTPKNHRIFDLTPLRTATSRCDSTRRNFFRLGLGFLAMISGCKMSDRSEEARTEFSVGPLSAFPLGLSPLVAKRVAILRDDRGLAAMSLVCTHQSCLLNTEVNGFRCPCHGSFFTREGRVTSGPAERELPWYFVSINEADEVFVDRGKGVEPTWRLPC